MTVTTQPAAALVIPAAAVADLADAVSAALAQVRVTGFDAAARVSQIAAQMGNLARVLVIDADHPGLPEAPSKDVAIAAAMIRQHEEDDGFRWQCAACQTEQAGHPDPQWVCAGCRSWAAQCPEYAAMVQAAVST